MTRETPRATAREPFLSRRRFLGGAAAVLPLPAFPSWVRAGEVRARRPAEAPKRLLVYHVPNGFHRKSFTPAGEGTDFRLSPTLAPLEDLRREILIPRGLANTVAVPVPQGGAHAVGMPALLTCTYPRREKIQVGVSFDQALAAAMGAASRHPSLQYGIDTIEGGQEFGWPLLYPRTLSWAGPTKPLPNVISPADAFDRLFLGFDPRATRAEIERRRALRTSVLDAVELRAASLRAELGAGDRPKVDEYLTAVRDVERRIQGVTPRSLPRRTGAPLPDETADLPARLRHFHDLIVLAFRLDVTRVITFSTGNALSTRPWGHLGIGDGHAQTHHGGRPERIESVKRIDLWRVQRFAELLHALRAARDPDGRSLLATSAVLYLSEVNDGNRHDQFDKPMVIAGQLGGAIRTGRVVYTARPSGPDGTFLDCSEESRTARTPLPPGCAGAPQLGDLYLGLLHAFGVPAATFGQTGTTPLDLG